MLYEYQKHHYSEKTPRLQRRAAACSFSYRQIVLVNSKYVEMQKTASGASKTAEQKQA